MGLFIIQQLFSVNPNTHWQLLTTADDDDPDDVCVCVEGENQFEIIDH